jgi:hypothetical protein
MGKGGLSIGLTLPPSCADCLEIWETQTPEALRACRGFTGIALASYLVMENVPKVVTRPSGVNKL